MTHKVTLRYSDGAVREMQVAGGESVLEAADASGIPVVSACLSGVCGTCVGRCTEGSYSLGNSVGLSRAEKAQGRLLACQARPRSDCVIELDYPLGSNAAQIASGTATVVQLEMLSPDTVRLELDAGGLSARLEFKPGQYAQLRVPGTQAWRAYSFMNAPREGTRLEFLIRLLPGGTMSEYLRRNARPGDAIDIRGPKGDFYLRPATRPIVLMAGGSGLSAILAIAEQLARDGCPQPIQLNYGVTCQPELVLVDRIEELARRHPRFTWRTVVREPSAEWHGAIGQITDLLVKGRLSNGDVDMYLCGPAGMVDATRSWLEAHGLHAASLYYERFLPTGIRPAPIADFKSASFDPKIIRQQGQGTAVVIGGSIAGICAAKVLTESFRKVIVLEKDPSHRRTDGRPGAAQGRHLHHLLIAGQEQLEKIFPGIIDDMTEAGAFKVDMGEQYRLMLAGAWKKPVRSGVDIVCAGRPLLEWCIRRRLDTESTVEYRYESEVKDLLLDESSSAVIGVVLERDGKREIVPAQFVVDAAGKNTPVPALLDQLGIDSPPLEEDDLNCFYSTMLHRVPAARRWTDKVMVICYPQRPQQQYYCAQYFTDSSRTILSTTLVGYNSYSPPRNAAEFRDFARRMPSSAVGDELDGLEPCSPVYNFRYPAMQRHRYEDIKDPPACLIAVGDAYSSPDPVSGAGMTKALLEIAELRVLLRARESRDRELVRQYYRRAAAIAESIWSVIREQNLRYPWVGDADRRRPFYFRAQNWYIDRVVELVHDDARVYRTYLMVTHLVAPPTALFAPRVVAKVLAKWLMTRLTLGKTLIERNFGK